MFSFAAAKDEIVTVKMQMFGSQKVEKRWQWCHSGTRHKSALAPFIQSGQCPSGYCNCTPYRVLLVKISMSDESFSQAWIKTQAGL